MKRIVTIKIEFKITIDDTSKVTAVGDGLKYHLFKRRLKKAINNGGVMKYTQMCHFIPFKYFDFKPIDIKETTYKTVSEETIEFVMQ